MAMTASKKVLNTYNGFQEWGVVSRDMSRLLSVHDTQEEAERAAEESVHPRQAFQIGPRMARQLLRKADNFRLAEIERHERAAREEADQPGAKVEPGMILCSTWGWEQTNVDFYEVTRATEKTVWLRPIASRQARQVHAMAEEVFPLPGQFTGPEFRRKIQLWAGEHLSVSITDFATASAWEGQPVLATSYA